MGKGDKSLCLGQMSALTAHSLCGLDLHLASLGQLFIFRLMVLRYVKCSELRAAGKGWVHHGSCW